VRRCRAASGWRSRWRWRRRWRRWRRREEGGGREESCNVPVVVRGIALGRRQHVHLNQVVLQIL